MQDQLEDLQIRWAHQELAIEALNETVARQDQQIVELRRELERLKQMLLELKPSPLGADTADEPPPPHY
jgi:SlyX protein